MSNYLLPALAVGFLFFQIFFMQYVLITMIRKRTLFILSITVKIVMNVLFPNTHSTKKTEMVLFTHQVLPSNPVNRIFPKRLLRFPLILYLFIRKLLSLSRWDQIKFVVLVIAKPLNFQLKTIPFINLRIPRTLSSKQLLAHVS